MNSNRKASKYTALTLTAGALIVSSAMTVGAAPLAGATSMTASSVTTDKKASDDKQASYSTRSGVSAMLSNMVVSSQQTASANKEAAEQAEKEKQQAIAVAAAQQAAQYASLGVANVTDYAYIRTAADANSEYAGKLYAGQVATVNSEEGDWYNITSGDVMGYINKQFLTVGDVNAIQAAATTIATVNTTTLKVRETASTDAKTLTMVPGTSELKVLDQSTDGWIQVETTDGNGYVSTDFVSLSTSYKFAESKEAEQARLAQEAAEKAAEEAAAKAAREAASKAKNKKSNSKSNSKSTGSEKSYSAPASSGNGSAVVNYASQFVGNPYVYGGSSLTNGTDCSGYVMSVYKAFGVSLPHSSSAMRGVGTGVSVSDMQPGDIVCYSGHVGIYAGNGQLLNASTPSTGIKYSSVNYKPILSVRRVY